MQKCSPPKSLKDIALLAVASVFYGNSASKPGPKQIKMFTTMLRLLKKVRRQGLAEGWEQGWYARYNQSTLDDNPYGRPEYGQSQDSP